MLTRIANRVMSKSVTCSASTSVQRICQSGILPEGSTSAYYGIYNLDYSKLSSESGRAKLLSAIKSFPSVLENVSESMQTQTVGTVSFGKKAWEYLASGREDLLKAAEDLVSFPGYGMAPATQTDIYIHIHSKKDSATFEASKLALSLFNGDDALLSVVDEKNGFMYKDSRDLTGFIDGTENPHGMESRVKAGLHEDGSSYVIVQRFVHNLSKWEKVDTKEQERVIGRTKHDSVQLRPVPSNSHVGRTDLKENGKGLKIVRQSLPYGIAGSEMGLWFTAYCGQLHNIDEIEKSLYGQRDGVTDRLMSYITPVTGSYFFVPSLDMIKEL